MTGGISDKRGNWYEEAFVVLNWLGLLAGTTHRVRWEPLGKEGDGVDCWVDEPTGRVAVQCKTRSFRGWNLGDLISEGVLAYAKQQLDHDPRCRFRFVTNSSSPQMEKLKDAALLDDGHDWPARCAEDAAKVTRLWYPECDLVTARGSVRNLLQRCEFVYITHSEITRHCEGLARLLTADARLLLDSVATEARRRLGEEVTASALPRLLEQAGVRLLPLPHLANGAEDLLNRCRAFVDGTRRLMKCEEIRRAEADLTIQKIQDAPRGGTVLVHGSVGSGKSVVLATVVDWLVLRDIPALVLHPDDEARSPGAPRGQLATLIRYASARRSVLVIDQLDQVIHAGAHAQRLVQEVAEWLRIARSAGTIVVIGCRTVDAAQDTQLHGIIDTRESPVEKISVGVVDDATVGRALAHEGIAPTSLPRRTLELARQPLALGILIHLHRRKISLGSHATSIELVSRWWDEVKAPIGPAADTTLDAIISAMESEGAFSVDRSTLANQHVVDALIESGVLIVEVAGGTARVRPWHQAIIDLLIARRWGGAVDGNELLRLIGSLDSQSFHQARRLRLTIPLLATRPSGPSILRELLASTAVRATLKQAALMGVAAIVSPPSALVTLVTDWLDDANVRPLPLSVVLWGNEGWVSATSSWIRRAWASKTVDHGVLLDLLGSVSKSWGDGVATLLREWIERDATLIKQVDLVLRVDPADDSEALFSLRLQHVVSGADHDLWFDWPKLMTANCRRGCLLLAALLAQQTQEGLTQSGPRWLHQFPTVDELSPAVLANTDVVWKAFRTWWSTVCVEDIRHVWMGHTMTRPCALAQMVDFLGRILAHGAIHGHVVIDDVIASRADDPLHTWLLLRIGAYVASIPAAQAENLERTVLRLVDWFTTNPKHAITVAGYDGGEWCRSLQRDFLLGIQGALDGASVARIEAFLISFADSWTDEDEAARLAWNSNNAQSIPDRLGTTPYLLLPALPSLSTEGEQRLAALREKFNGHEGLFRPHVERGFGWVGPEQQDEVADCWSLTQWLAQLRDAPSGAAARHRQVSDGRIASSDIDNLSMQLGRLASACPARYVTIAEAIAAAEPPLQPIVKQSVLQGVLTMRRPDRAPPGAWEPVPDDVAVGLAALTGFTSVAGCAKVIIRAIGERPTAPWDEKVLSVAFAAASASNMVGTGDLSSRVINETTCVAITSIAEVAKRQAHLAKRVYGIIDGQMVSSDSAVRLACALAAVDVVEIDPAHSYRVVLAAAQDVEVAAELVRPLLWMAASPNMPAGPEKTAAITAIVAMCSDDREEIGRAGGDAVLALWAQQGCTLAELDAVLARSSVVRVGAARSLAGWLRQSTDVPSSALDLALRFADDAEEEVGAAMLHAFASGRADHLLRERRFFDALVTTAAARRDPSELLEACDRQNQLLPLADLILATAKVIAEPNATRDRWQLWSSLRQALAVLSRLVEESERVCEWETRSRAMDVWDLLIPVHIGETAGVLDRHC